MWSKIWPGQDSDVGSRGLQKLWWRINNQNNLSQPCAASHHLLLSCCNWRYFSANDMQNGGIQEIHMAVSVLDMQDCRFAPRGGVLLSARIFFCPKLLLGEALPDSPLSAGMCCSLLLFKQRLCHPRYAWVIGWIKWTILYSILGGNEQF